MHGKLKELCHLLVVGDINHIVIKKQGDKFSFGAVQPPHWFSDDQFEDSVAGYIGNFSSIDHAETPPEVLFNLILQMCHIPELITIKSSV